MGTDADDGVVDDAERDSDDRERDGVAGCHGGVLSRRLRRRGTGGHVRHHSGVDDDGHGGDRGFHWLEWRECYSGDIQTQSEGQQRCGDGTAIGGCDGRGRHILPGDVVPHRRSELGA